MSSERNKEMTLKDFVLILWGFKWITLSCVALFGMAAAFYAQTEQPVYTVDVTLQLETKSKASGTALGAMSEIFQGASAAETEIEVIKSRMVLGRASDALKLQLLVEPIAWGRWARLWKKTRPELSLERFDVPKSLWNIPFELEVLDNADYVLKKYKTDEELIRGKIGVGIDSGANVHRIGIFVNRIDAKVHEKFRIVHADSLAGIEFLRGNLSVAEVGKKTGIIGLTYSGTDPERNAQIANAIANMYVRQDVEQKSAEAEKTLEFLQEQLPELKKRLEDAEERLNQHRSQMGTVDLTEEARIALAQQVDVQQKLFDIQQRRREAMQLFKADHPSIKSYDSAILNLSSKMGNQEKQVKALPLQQQEVLRLMRDVQVNTELYTSLLNNSQQLKVVKAGEIGNVRIIDHAVPIYRAVKPKKSILILVGLFIGLLVGSGIALLRNMMNIGVLDPAVLEGTLGLPVYASVPHSVVQERLQRKMRRQESGLHLLAVNATEDLAMESLRSLRTTLHFSMLDAPNKILLFAGPSPSIGKSFVCANFAATLALSGQKVLLIDADLRRGRMHQYFGLPRGIGLSDLLSGIAEIKDGIIETGVNGLSFLSTGTLPPNPSELLLHENFNLILEDIKARFDYVIIDSAPVLAVTDGVILGKLAGTTLMVLKHGSHPIEEIDACKKRLEQANVTLKGVVFNDIKSDRGGSRVYGGAIYQYAYAKLK